MIEFTACPDPDCAAPAEVLDRFDSESTDGPVDHAKTRCATGHVYCGPSRTPERVRIVPYDFEEN